MIVNLVFFFFLLVSLNMAQLIGQLFDLLFKFKFINLRLVDLGLDKIKVAYDFLVLPFVPLVLTDS